MEKLVLTESNNKKIEILDMLLSIPHDLTIEMVSNHLRVSDRKTLNYLQSLNFLFKEENMTARINMKKEKLALSCDCLFSLNEIKKIYCEDSDEFKILKRILFCSNVKINDLADELYVSRATIARKIKTLKGKLEKYSITIENRPLRIVGDEYKIILFYSSLFWDIYGENGWPFGEVVSRKEIEKFYELFAANLDKQHVIESNPQVYFQLAILYIRIIKRQIMSIKNKPRSTIYSLEAKSFNNKLNSKVLPVKQYLYFVENNNYCSNKQKNEMIEKDLKLYTFIFFQNTSVSELGEYSELKRAFLSACMEDGYEVASKILEHYQKQRFITVGNMVYLLEQMVNGLLEIEYWNEELIKEKYEMLNKYNKNNLSYQLIEQKLTNTIAEIKVYFPDENTSKSVILYIISHILMPYINSKYDGWYVNVRIISVAGEVYEEKIGEMLKNKHKISVTSSSSKEVTSDLIITDGKVKSEESQVLSVSFPMSELDFKRADEKINNIHKSKIQQEKRSINKEENRIASQRKLRNESGSSLVEVVCALLILSFIFVGSAKMILQNQEAINLTRQKAEAEDIKMEIKEWLNEFGVRDDVAALNRICFNGAKSLVPNTKKRSKYFILDDTGIVYDASGKGAYGEHKFATYFIGVSSPKEPSRRVTYDSVILPPSLAGKEGSIGYYRKNNKYLVGCEVVDIDKEISKALNLELTIYDKKTGRNLVTTNFKFIYQNNNTENPVYMIEDGAY